jgi:hypothetical protein
METDSLRELMFTLSYFVHLVELYLILILYGN